MAEKIVATFGNQSSKVGLPSLRIIIHIRQAQSTVDVASMQRGRCPVHWNDINFDALSTERSNRSQKRVRVFSLE